MIFYIFHQQIQQTVLDTLTPDDIRVLIATVDEDSRKGGFERVFPTAKSSKYLKFFEQPRYYNLLLNQWVQRYNKMEARGVALLDSFCQKWVHVQSPTTDPYHQWSPPNATPRTLSAPSSKPGVGNSSSTSQLPKLRKKNNKPIQKMSHSGSASSLDKYMMPSNPPSKQNR
ncbi:tubulin polyglutamylase TTLL4-like [Lingula anatina]|uniref:Tubulin polyglutamylase TTLL4-like n=1 Tax=Lingula anatina TaxID=7574 RepID=A0A1S3IT37_LINAN|nr:tubulin polyglutamylase TTLL4-like [Lingula anatina]|eukprot:XP_013401243.1 tubulin polyglutamylase TTLL4-like [Lingula anatina]